MARCQYTEAMQRAVIVLNPSARKPPSRERLRAAAASVRPAGWEVDVLCTESAGHATALAREAAATGAAVVFACGGDGTLNEVANGLVGSESTLGALRGGMGNVFAKEVGVPRSPEAALRLLVEGERRRIDLGVAGTGDGGQGRHFVLMAGVGFDAEVVRRVPESPKRLLGTTAYVLWGVRELARYRSAAARLRIDGEAREAELFWLIVGNTRSYGGVIDVTAKALADDGCLDAYVFAGRGLRWTLATGLRLVLRRHDGAPGVSFHRVHELAVETAGLPVQADGEYFGETPMRFWVAPRAISVLLPRGRAARLFSSKV